MPRRRGDDTVAFKTQPDQPPPERWRLVVGVAGGVRLRRVVLGPQPLSVGKHHSADIQLADPHVSDHHLQIAHTPRGVQVRDLGSLNGTHVEGIAIQEVVLTRPATITVGKSELRLELDAAEPNPDDEPRRFGDAVGSSRPMRAVFGLLHRLAASDLTVTLIGETGVGKEVLARGLHDAGPRAGAPFGVFDCGAVAPTLIESELFGHQKGAFTGAIADRPGAFERCDGGTLFLDEIGELALELQPKLLRVIEQREVARLGGGEARSIDIRIVAATNRDLEEEVRRGRFREDLYFRITGAVVRVPPLRERLDDLPELIAAIDGRLALSPEALAVLRAYHWPGNVRELRNVLDAASAVAAGPVLEPRDFILFHKRRRDPTLDNLPLGGRSLQEIERAAIRQTLDKVGGNKTHAARALGIAASTLYEKIKKYGL